MKEEGWLPQHIVVRNDEGELLGCCPLYLKGHSYGEYVFDQSWGQYAEMLGMRYYPKLQSCVPFSPVAGPRLMSKPGAYKEGVIRAIGQALIQVASR